MQEIIKRQILDSIEVKEKILNNDELIKKIEEIGKIIIQAYKSNKKVLIFGNGGSAADSQHLAAELVGRFKRERRGLPAIALTTDTSILTSIANDYSYERLFERQVEALCQEGDVVIGISTSGNSKNITNAFDKAHEFGAFTVGLLGKAGGENLGKSDIAIIVPSNDTARIQESHIMIGHIVCDIVESNI